MTSDGSAVSSPEDGGVLRAEPHQVLERRLVQRARRCGGGAKRVFIQEEGDEEGEEDGHQRRTWVTDGSVSIQAVMGRTKQTLTDITALIRVQLGTNETRPD